MLVIEGKSRESILQEERAKWEEMTVQEHMDYYTNQGIDKKEAMEKGGEGSRSRKEGHLQRTVVRLSSICTTFFKKSLFNPVIDRRSQKQIYFISETRTATACVRIAQRFRRQK